MNGITLERRDRALSLVREAIAPALAAPTHPMGDNKTQTHARIPSAEAQTSRRRKSLRYPDITRPTQQRDLAPSAAQNRTHTS